jgi:hypothetical protein
MSLLEPTESDSTCLPSFRNSTHSGTGSSLSSPCFPSFLAAHLPTNPKLIRPPSFYFTITVSGFPTSSLSATLPTATRRVFATRHPPLRNLQVLMIVIICKLHINFEFYFISVALSGEAISDCLACLQTCTLLPTSFSFFVFQGSEGTATT